MYLQLQIYQQAPNSSNKTIKESSSSCDTPTLLSLKDSASAALQHGHYLMQPLGYSKLSNNLE